MIPPLSNEGIDVKAEAEKIVDANHWMTTRPIIIKHITDILEDLMARVRDKAYEKAAKICRESVRMAEPGAATQWIECDKNPFQLEKEILALKSSPVPEREKP